jgi:hypothetical protein
MTVNNEMERIWKGAVMILLKILSRGTKRTTETSVRIVGDSAEIQTGHVPNTSQKYYHLGHLVRNISVT